MHAASEVVRCGEKGHFLYFVCCIPTAKMSEIAPTPRIILGTRDEKRDRAVVGAFPES
jgi:hypothetical protein